MQKTTVHNGFVPVISSLAGSSLTLANWEKSGTIAISIHLQHLLMKPGLSLLNRLDTIRSYYKWPHVIILNALMPSLEEGVYKIRSLYDGSVIEIDTPSFFLLIAKLKPEKVILPFGSHSYLSEYSKLLEGVQILIPNVRDNEQAFSSYIQQIKNTAEPFYCVGDFSLEEMRALSAFPSSFFETEAPAQAGMRGRVYTQAGLLSLMDENLKNIHQPIDKDCQCETCSQNLTQAYFYHLLEHTPLLAQRFLIQHNVFYCRKHLSSLRVREISL